MLPVFSWQITSTSKDKGNTLFIYGKKARHKKKVKINKCKKNNQKKVINMRFISREFITL